jgi:metallo-beta-lactamase class B
MLAATIYALAVAWAVTGQGPVDEPFPAHRVIGNVYYVGSKDLASYLITTPEGHILINSSFEETIPLIRAGVESLGFKMRDIKVLLASHAHSDHVAGHALAKELTGAKVYVMRGDEAVVASGGAGQYFYTTSRWKPCAVDRVLEDGDEVKLGGVTLVARRTPGHTRGCTTWTCRVADSGKDYDVVVIGSPNVNPGYRLVDNKDYPEIAADFAETFQILKSLPCDVFLGAHGAYYGMIEKYKRAQNGAEKNPFVDPEGYRAYVEKTEKAFRDTLAKQRATSGNARTRPGDLPAARGQTVRIAGIVLKWIRADKEANYRRIEPLIRQAAEQGARIVCTTECFLDGYAIADKTIALDQYRALGERIPEGEFCKRLMRLADELDIHLIAGLLEADGEARYNTAILVGPDGRLIGTYRKQKLGHELGRNTPGDSSPVFRLASGRVGVMICADRTEPTIVRRLCEQGADVLICPSGGMFGPAVNDPIVQARSRENAIPIVFVHPAEFLVTRRDGSIAARTIQGDRLLIEPGQQGSEHDRGRVFYFDMPLPIRDAVAAGGHRP